MVFTQNEIIELIEDDDIPETIQNDLVREVVDSWHWNEGMDDALAETGYALLNEVIRDILDI
jgi:glutamate racemase